MPSCHNGYCLMNLLFGKVLLLVLCSLDFSRDQLRGPSEKRIGLNSLSWLVTLTALPIFMTTSEEIKPAEGQQRPGKRYPQRMVESVQHLCCKNKDGCSCLAVNTVADGQWDKTWGTFETAIWHTNDKTERIMPTTLTRWPPNSPQPSTLPSNVEPE